MLNKILVVGFLFLLILPLGLAVDFNVGENYDKGETLITKLSGNFIGSVSEDNVFFYRRHMRVPMEFEIFNIEDEFYIYALIPSYEDNYSISIEDVEYYVGQDISEENIVREFSISNKSAIFSVNPGVVSSNESFYLEVQNLQAGKIEISYDSFSGFELGVEEENEDEGFWDSFFGGEDKEEEIIGGDSVELKSGEKKKIDFKFGNVTKSSLNTISLSSGGLNYNIPVYLIKNSDEVNATEEEEEEEIIIIIEEEEVVEEEEEAWETCAEINGTKCEDNEECDGLEIDTDVRCCLADCVKEESSSFIKIFGWILIAFIFGFLIWFFKFRYRGAKRKVSLLGVGRKGAGKGVR